MVTRPNISKKKVARFTLGVVLVALFAGLLIAATLTRKSGFVKELNIATLNQEIGLVPKSELEQVISAAASGDFRKMPLKDLDLEQIEKAVEQNPWIQNAEAFVDNKQVLQLELLERVPVARVFSNNGKSYYIDTAGRLLPDDVSVPMLVPVFTNVPYLGNDEMSRKLGRSIVYLGSLIADDTFWNAQITQINVLPNGNFEMAPMIGNHKIIFGDSGRAKDKLHNLFVFYSKGLGKLGWDRYQVIDVRFRGQVVTSPGIDYVAPIVADTAVDLPDQDDRVAHELGKIQAAPPVQQQAPAGNVAAPPPDKPKEVSRKEAPRKKRTTSEDTRGTTQKSSTTTTSPEKNNHKEKKKEENKQAKSKYLLPKKN